MAEAPSARPARRRPFGERLVAAAEATGPLCAGIDPSGALLPPGVSPTTRRASAPSPCGASRRSPGSCRSSSPRSPSSSATAPPGSPCWRRRRRRPDAGLLVIADAKRGDFDVTDQAYADAWLGPAARWRADAVTVHPYLGLTALAAVLRRGARHGQRRAASSCGAATPRAGSSSRRRDRHGRRRGGQHPEAASPSGTGREGAAVGSLGAVVGATLRAVGVRRSPNSVGVISGARASGPKGRPPPDVARCSAAAARRPCCATCRARCWRPVRTQRPCAPRPPRPGRKSRRR